MKEISERLGHSRISITMDTYSHVTDKMRNETVDIMENLRKEFLIFATEKTTGGKPVANPCKHGLFFTLFSNKPCYFFGSSSSIFRTAMKASCGTSTEPICFMRFLPSFVFQKVFVYAKHLRHNILPKRSYATL